MMRCKSAIQVRGAAFTLSQTPRRRATRNPCTSTGQLRYRAPCRTAFGRRLGTRLERVHATRRNPLDPRHGDHSRPGRGRRHRSSRPRRRPHDHRSRGHPGRGAGGQAGQRLSRLHARRRQAPRRGRGVQAAWRRRQEGGTRGVGEEEPLQEDRGQGSRVRAAVEVRPRGASRRQHSPERQLPCHHRGDGQQERQGEPGMARREKSQQAG